MSKIGIIIKREYSTRVRNKTFLLLTFIAPIFYGLLLLMPLLAQQLGKETRLVQVVDNSGKFKDRLQSDQTTVFYFKNQTKAEIQKNLKKEKSTLYVLYIPQDFDIFKPQGIELLSKKNVGATFKTYLDTLLANRVRTMKMEALRLTGPLMDSLKTTVDVTMIKNTETGLQESSSEATSAAAVIGGILIYIFIFLYGGMVLRGVQEEKQNRVVEIIISSVKPFELMMGKIIGIALVGLSQFILWVLLTVCITSISGKAIMMTESPTNMASQAAGAHVEMDQALNALGTLPIPLLIAMFIFFFIGGYLLYSSLFAAFASAVDSQTDIYQFMFPVSLPIIFSISMLPAIIENPDSSIAFWFSIIPLTSPVIMMARLPFEVPAWQLLLSMAMLVIGFLFTTWLAGKIYRTGILMYGKKITYKELIKWLFYRN